jgi:hypothetical protein
MATTSNTIRVALVLTAAGSAAFCYFMERDAEKTRAEEQYYEDAYQSIHPGMWPRTVKELLGPHGKVVDIPGWPNKIGEVPGYKERYPLTEHLSARAKWEYDLRFSRKVWWMVWAVPGKHHWIAIAFYDDGSGGGLGVPVVVMKKSGLKELQ